MPRALARLSPPSALLAATCLADTARAELPEPADFTVEYLVTDEAGEPVRTMTEADHRDFLNRARCECGQQVGARVRMTSLPADITRRIEVFVGTMCAVAEVTITGEHKRCGKLASLLVANFAEGIAAAFHPAFLAHGTQPSEHRGVDDPETQIAGACEGAGEAGLWMCMPGENNLANCQEDEFFLRADEPLSGLSGVPTLSYDFTPPLTLPTDLTVEPGNGAALLSWDLPTAGDIVGLRVLCEEADGGAAPGLEFPAPGLTDAHDGRHYFTAGDLCGGQPFTDVALTPRDEPNACGNGLVEPGEICDDGQDNGPEGLCDDGCQLRVGAGLHALAWAHVCSDHLDVGERSVVVGPLANGAAYNFVLVAYDSAGNPRALGQVVTATPDAGLPDLLPGDDGCGCTTGPGGHGLLAMSLGTLIALGRRRRARR